MPRQITIDGVTTTIPEYADVVDGEVSFTEFMDGLARTIANRMQRINGTVTEASTGHAVVRNIHVSTAQPTDAQGMDGDVWLVVV